MSLGGIPAAGLDRVGFWLSASCAVHCALMPLAIAAFPLLGLSIVAGEGAEWLLAISSATLGTISVALGCVRHHRRIAPVVVAAVGIAFVAMGRLWHGEGQLVETLAMVTGGVTIAVAHFLNARLCRTCATRRETDAC